MENASKALLMAGGVILVMMIIALVIFAWNTFSDFYSSKDELENIEDISEFNLQFTNYDRNDVTGYEIISLANKIADYNTRYSNAESAQNDKEYTPITLDVDLISQENIKTQLTFSGDSVRLFTTAKSSSDGHTFRQSSVRNDIGSIITEALGIEKLYGNTDTASKIAKNINTLVFDKAKEYYKNKNMTDVQIKEAIVKDFNKLAKTNYTMYTEVENDIGNNGEKIYKYYEYYQFKRSIFKCTNVEYDDASGRVSKIDFKFVKVE